MNVYLDDERETPEGWERVFWPEEAIELLKTEKVEEISLDHDVGVEHPFDMNIALSPYWNN